MFPKIRTHSTLHLCTRDPGDPRKHIWGRCTFWCRLSAEEAKGAEPSVVPWSLTGVSAHLPVGKARLGICPDPNTRQEYCHCSSQLIPSLWATSLCLRGFTFWHQDVFNHSEVSFTVTDVSKHFERSGFVFTFSNIIGLMWWKSPKDCSSWQAMLR